MDLPLASEGGEDLPLASGEGEDLLLPSEGEEGEDLTVEEVMGETRGMGKEKNITR